MKKADILIVGTGVSGLFCALNLPEDKNILMITKDICENSDSFLAQGGICVLKDEKDMQIELLQNQINELRKEMKNNEQFITNVNKSEVSTDTSTVNESIGKSVEDDKPTSISRVSTSKKK